MRVPGFRWMLCVVVCLGLAGCYQVQVKGPVGGSRLVVSSLEGGNPVVELTSWDRAFLFNLYGPETWTELSDLARLVFLGVVVPDKTLFVGEGFYLLSANGGNDLDVDQNLVIDDEGTPVLSQLHALASGPDLRIDGVKVSVLTEIVYQYLRPSLSSLTAIDLATQLDLLTQRMIGDVEDDGVINYRDLLQWSQIFNRDALLVDLQLLSEFEDAVLAGESEAELHNQAISIVESGEPRSGAMVYQFPRLTGNSFSCATCHAIVEPAANGLRRPGHPLGSSTRRDSYKDGQLNSMLDAVNSCLDEWMNADAWSESTPDWLALSQWLEAHAEPGDAPLVDVQISPPPADLGGGIASAGRETFNESCAICHAEDGLGTNKAPPVAGFGLPAELIANRVRLSGRNSSPVYAGLSGGIMPFWGANRLSDAELVDLVAYLGDGEDDSIGGGGDGGDGGSSGCGSDHPKVGQSTSLITRAHRVSGTVTAVDNCTLELTNFIYDGRGIVVQAYTGQDGNFFGDGVHAISANLVGPSYNDATLRFSLPTGVSLDDFNSFSIWCVAVGVSFGDGIFQ